MKTYSEHRSEQWLQEGRVEVTKLAASDTSDVVKVVGTNGISHGTMYFVRKDDNAVDAWQREVAVRAMEAGNR